MKIIKCSSLSGSSSRLPQNFEERDQEGQPLFSLKQLTLSQNWCGSFARNPQKNKNNTIKDHQTTIKTIHKLIKSQFIIN
jgi:hypothetical protein